MNSSYSVIDVKVKDKEISIISARDLNVVSIHPPAAEEEPVVEEEELVEGEELAEEDGAPSEETDGKASAEDDGDKAD